MTNSGTPCEDFTLPAWTPSWITRDLIELTRKIFEPRYKASLCLDEVVKILQSVGTLLDVVIRPTPRELAS